MREFLETGGNIPFTVRQRFELARGVSLAPADRASRKVRLSREALDSTLAAGDAASRVLLRASEVTPLSEEDAFVRVFVNKPGASAATPITDAHYAGSFAFFEDPSSHAPGKVHRTPDFYVDITNTVRRLRQAGEISARDSISIDLVAVPYENKQPGRGRIRLDRLELVTTPVAVKGT